MLPLRQSTAATVLVGPVMDSAGAPVATGVAVGDFSLVKNGVRAHLAGPATATHDENGHYLIALAVGNTDTTGHAVITMNNASFGMPPAEFLVLPPVSYDRIMTGLLGTPRPLDAVANGSVTLDDADWSSIGQGVGRWSWPAGSTTEAVTTPDGTVTLRTFTLDSATKPRRRT